MVSHAGVGAAEDCPIKAGIPRSAELVSQSPADRTGARVPFSRDSSDKPPSSKGNLSSMVLPDAPTRMSRTDEVHRITENVYKVRR